MDLDAVLTRLDLLSPDAESAAAFYSLIYGFQVRNEADGSYTCVGAAGEIGFAAGTAHTLASAVFEFKTQDGWDRFRAHARLANNGFLVGSPNAQAQVSVRDPDGNLILFRSPQPSRLRDTSSPAAITTPGGVGAKRTPPLWLCHGDVVEVEISRVGLLINSVVDARQR